MEKANRPGCQERFTQKAQQLPRHYAGPCYLAPTCFGVQDARGEYQEIVRQTLSSGEGHGAPLGVDLARSASMHSASLQEIVVRDVHSRGSLREHGRTNAAHGVPEKIAAGNQSDVEVLVEGLRRY